MLNKFIHHNFLFLLCSCYLLAAYFPACGLAIQHFAIGSLPLPGLGVIKLTVPPLMLAILLFNSGLGIRSQELRDLVKNPAGILAGFTANLFMPSLFIFALFAVLRFWHNNDELQNILMGLALIAAMPIAGSASAWTQNVNGNVSLALGLIICSTLLSPLTGPKIISLFTLITRADYASDLAKLAGHSTAAFLSAVVVLPSFLGILAHYLTGEDRIQNLKPQLKTINFVILLLLNYCNGSQILPQVFQEHDLDFIAVICLITFSLSVVCFASGWLIARFLQLGKADMASLMFALGMSNNGSGLVLVSLAMPQHAGAMLPLIICILAQQIVAAMADRWIFQRDAV